MFFEFLGCLFQYCVILDSNKTNKYYIDNIYQFQYCVILDSNKTIEFKKTGQGIFQYCVILDSNKTIMKVEIQLL